MFCEYFWEQMVNLLHTSFHIYDENLNLEKRLGGSDELTCFLEGADGVKEQAFAHMFSRCPALYMEPPLLFAVFGEDAAEGKRILAGPVMLEPASREEVRRVYRRYGPEIKCEYLPPVISLETFVSGLLLLHGQLTGEEMPAARFWEMNRKYYGEFQHIRQQVVKDVFSQQENAGTHNPYEQELRELYSIERGDASMLASSISETYEGDFGILSKDPLRSHKNLVIGNITMASRAAIRGGLSVEEAFTVADSLIRQLEELDSILEVSVFKQEAQHLYIKLVSEARKKEKISENPLVGQVKEYIFTHLHETIKVSAIAKSLQVNPDYLSHLFRLQEKMTISQYIRREKVKRAENLLRYSDYRIQDIAFYLGFSTQSHFAKAFCEVVGISPNAYRKKFRDWEKWDIK